jgi:iron complex transport system permease protein
MFWLLGYFGNATFLEVTLSALVILLCCIFLIPLTPGINALSLGSQQASHLGVPVRGVSSALYIIGSLLAAVVVSFVGTIAFVGLIVPHFARRILGADHRILIPGSFLLGVLFLVVSDLLARTILYPVEMPVGAITSALGAPLVVYILRKER